MAKIVRPQGLISIVTSIKRDKKSIVLVGGCFDILHIGHIKFLHEAKKMGDCLIVLLESDEKVQGLKGKNRPLFTQKERAQVLSSISFADYVVLLPTIRSEKNYEDLVLLVQPNIIATTEGDPLLTKKKNQAKKAKTKVKIIPQVKTYSSSKLSKLLGIE